MKNLEKNNLRIEVLTTTENNALNLEIMKTVKVYLLVATTLLLVAFMSSCENDGIIGIRGQGEMVNQTILVNDFTQVSSEISGNLHITYGTEKLITVSGQQNILDNLDFDVENGKLEIEFDKNVRNHDGLNIFITTDDLDYIALNGSGNIVSTNKFVSPYDVEYVISGSGDIDFEVEAPNVKTTITGSGNINLETKTSKVTTVISGSGNANLNGIAEALDIIISGSGDISAYNLPVSNADVNISGSGNCNLFVESNLNITISGSGDISYKGSPQISTKITGSGNIRNAN